MQRILHADQREKQNHKEEIICWLFTKNFLHWKKELDWNWTRQIFFLRVWGVEESNVSSSSFTTNASRRRRSGSFLENENFQTQFPKSIHWSDARWTARIETRWGEKRRFQYCTDASGTIVYFRALQGHSGRNLIDPSLQDNVVFPSNFFQHIYQIGCAFNLNSIINSGLIPGGQSSSKRQTVFFMLVDLMDKSHKDPNVFDSNVPRRAQYLHNAWQRHQDAVYWFDIDLAIRNGLTFYQTRWNAIILQRILPAYCIPKIVRMKIGEVLFEKVNMSPRPPPKISLKHEWERGIRFRTRSTNRTNLL